MCRKWHNHWAHDRSVSLVSLLRFRMCGVPPTQHGAAGRGPWAADRRKSACLHSAATSTNCFFLQITNCLVSIFHFIAACRAGLLLRVMPILFQFIVFWYDILMTCSYILLIFDLVCFGHCSKNLIPIHWKSVSTLFRYKDHYISGASFLSFHPRRCSSESSLCVFLLTAVERNNLMRLANTIPFTPVSSLGIFGLFFFFLLLFSALFHINVLHFLLSRRRRSEHLLFGGSTLGCWTWHWLLLVLTRPDRLAAAPPQRGGVSGRRPPPGLQGAVHLGGAGSAHAWSRLRGQGFQAGSCSSLAEVLPW